MKKSSKLPPKPSKIARLSGFFYDKVGLSVVLWTSLFLFGLFSYTVFMQRQGFPQVDVPISFVQGIYFVDDRSKVDEQVTKPVLDAISDIDSIKSTTANSGDNQATIIIEYEEGVTSQEGSDAVEAEVEKIQDTLPQEAQLVFNAVDATRYNNKYDILLSVSSGEASINDLLDRAEEVTNLLKQKLPDAELIEVAEPFEEGVNPATGEATRRQTSFDWYGNQENGSVDINQSVVIGVSLKDNEDIIAFDNELNKAVEEVNNQYDDVEINVAASFAPSIRQQISSLQGNLFAGLTIVVIICMIFIGWRAGVLAAVGLAVTLTTAVGILYLFGMSLNTISLFALVLCLGLIVDDTIIIVEAIDAQNAKAKNLRQAVLKSVDKIALASAAGTFTTVLGFAPLLFISGILGEFIRLLPITIITVLIVSLVMSLLFI
ncbi:efflux RND transporter permease subunit, partial [Candidatus Saccharibacteria bacterium]|nr:efflux RND transporter permease subunit [Candidatus Saccharibacteria bacterium]